VTEDDGAVMELLRRTLAETGFAVDLARTVAQAVAALGRTEYDAVLLDYKLPDGEPWPVLELTRQRAEAIPVIIMIGMGDERAAAKACQLGAAEFFIKGGGLTAFLPCMVSRAIARIEEQRRWRATEAELRGLMTNIPDVLWSITADRRKLLYISPSCERIFGYHPEEFRRDIWLGYRAILPEDQPVVDAVCQQSALTRQPQQIEYRLRRRDGAVRWLRGKITPVVNEAGEIARYDGLVADITEQKQTELELARRNLELSVLDRVNRGLAAPLDVEAALGEAVTLFQQGFGYLVCSVYLLDREQHTLSLIASSGYPIAEAYHVLPLSSRGLIPMVAATGTPIHSRDARRDPHYLAVDERVCAEYATPLRRGAEIIGVLNIEGDREGGFTERELSVIDSFAVQAAIALTQAAMYREAVAARDKFLDLYHNAPDGYHSCTPDGTIIEINDTELKRLGYAREEVVGKLRFQDLLTASEAARLPELMAELAEKGSLSLESAQVKRDRTTMPVRIQAKAIYRAAGELQGYYSRVRDISAEKQLLAQLIQAQKIDSVGRLAGGIAHDFNNLLTGILGFTALAMRQLGKDHPTYASLVEVERAAQRAARLVSQLLAYSRRQLAKPEPLDLNQLVRETAKFLARTLPETIKINLRLAEAVETVRADHAQLQQVLLNLCVNARDAMSEGGELLIETGNARLDEEFVSRHLGAKAGAYTYFRVTDTGAGMDAGTLARIFEPFFTTKEVGQGTGLGLAMVYGIVKSHDGYVTVESQPGQGAVFQVYLPSCDAQVKPLVAPLPQIKGGSETILIVEDEPMVAGLAQEVLAGYGYTVFITNNGRDALAAYRERRGTIDLVIADVVMPEMGGTELYQALKRLNPQAQVLLSSGYSLSPDLRNFIAQGVPFIQKPYQVEELACVVREILDAVSPSAASASDSQDPSVKEKVCSQV
jgi:PAS domain S-box-containing protein